MTTSTHSHKAWTDKGGHVNTMEPIVPIWGSRMGVSRSGPRDKANGLIFSNPNPPASDRQAFQSGEQSRGVSSGDPVGFQQGKLFGHGFKRQFKQQQAVA